MKKFLLLFSILIFFMTPIADAKVRSAKLAVDIPPGKNKVVRLKNLPQNAMVKVEAKSNGTVNIFFIDQKNYEKYPNIKRPLFQSQIIDSLSFTLNIPSFGHYYIVFNNASRTRPVKVDVIIHGASGNDAILMKNILPGEHNKDIRLRTIT